MEIFHRYERKFWFSLINSIYHSSFNVYTFRVSNQSRISPLRKDVKLRRTGA